MNFVAFFALHSCSEEVIKHFNDFLKNQKTNEFSYEKTHGEYKSTENLNQGYNYLLKIKHASQHQVDEEYNVLLKELAPYLGKKRPVSFYYAVVNQYFNSELKKASQINHTVLLPFKENCSDIKIKEVFLQLSSLCNVLKNINSFHYGYSLASEKTYIFEMEFPDSFARDAYLISPEHIKTANFIIPLLCEGVASVIAFDYFLPKVNESMLKTSPRQMFTLPKEIESKNSHFGENISKKL